MDSAVNWKLVPAVHYTAATGQAHCIHEAACDFELAGLCAFNQTTFDQGVAFIGCMDEQVGGWVGWVGGLVIESLFYLCA